MKKLVYAGLALVLLPPVAQADPGLDEAGEHQQKRLAHLTKVLQLSEQQQQQVEQLWQRQGDKFKALHQETQAGMQEILDAEQYAKFKELKHERRLHAK